MYARIPTPAAARIQQSVRNLFRRFVILGAGLLILALPVAAFAGSPKPADDDPFDRPGFYVGLGGSYQYNVFKSHIEDEIANALEDQGVANVDVDLGDSGGLNAVVGYRLASFFAAELEYEWVDEYKIKGSVPGFEGTVYGIEGHTLTGNTKWIIPFWRIQPYLLLGGGVAISHVDRGNAFDIPAVESILQSAGIDVKSGNHTNAAARAGLGLDIYLTENILVNTEASVVVTTLKKPDLGDVDDLNYMSFAGGLQYRF